MNTYSIARQPILDRTLQLYAYELLFRQHKSGIEEISFTSEVLATAIFDIGLDNVTGNNLAFINMSYQDIMNPAIDALPTDKVVLELLEDIEIDDALVKRVQQLADQGFLIALDDFVYSPQWEPLIDAASIIKLDLTVLTVEENQALVNQLQGRSLKFLAEKVESYEEFEVFKKMGCDYFQGYFLCRPEQLKGQSISSNMLLKTRLLAEINDPKTSIEQLDLIIQQDPSLSFKLIKYLNSAHFAFISPIKNIKQAIVMIGIQGIKKWATLLGLRNLSAKPSELTRISLVRAKLAETVASNNNITNPNSYFLGGLFSTLDAMLDTSMEEILATMPLDVNLKNALSKKEGELGLLLQAIMTYEKTGMHPFDNPRFSNNDYIEACTWADDIMSAL